MRGIIVLAAFFLMNCASVTAFGYEAQMDRQSAACEVALVLAAE